MINLRAITEVKSNKDTAGTQSLSRFSAAPVTEKTLTVPRIFGNLAQPLQTEIGEQSDDKTSRDDVVLISIERSTDLPDEYRHLRQGSDTTDSGHLDAMPSGPSRDVSLDYGRSPLLEESSPLSSDPLHGQMYEPIEIEDWTEHSRGDSLARNESVESRTTIHGVIRGQVDGAPQLTPLFYISTDSNSSPPRLPPKDALSPV